jgi:O-antigen ligase
MASGVLKTASGLFGSGRIDCLLRRLGRHESEREFSGTEEMTTQSVRLAADTVWFRFSAIMFLMGLALVTFEEVRPLGFMLSDYCFLLSVIFVPKSRLFKPTGSGVLLGGALIIAGALLSLHDGWRFTDGASSLLRLFLLFGLIAPLSLCHSKNLHKSLFFLAGGIFVNCFITLLQATILPKIVDTLSINPPQPDVAFIGRYQGLTEFPVTLGLSAALGVLIAVGLFSIEKSRLVRWGLALVIIVCSIGALLSGSRTFLASLIPALITFAVLQENLRRTVVYALAAVVLLWGTATYLLPRAVSDYADRLESVGFVDVGRLAAASQAVLEIVEKPVLGWGVDHFEEAGIVILPDTAEVAGVHNTFLRYWYAAGLLGAIGFLTLFVTPARNMVLILKQKSSRKLIRIVRLVLACYVFFFIVSNLGPYLYNRYLYVPMFVFAGFVAHAVGPIREQKIAPWPALDLTAKNNATS